MRVFIIILASLGTMVAAAFTPAEAADVSFHAARRTISVTSLSRSLSEAQGSARSQAEA